MRKKNKRKQDKELLGQGDLFSSGSQVPQGDGDGGTAKVREGLSELLSRLSSQLASTEHLLEEIVSENNIGRAYQQVKANDGTSGVDGQDIEQTGAWLTRHLKEFQEQLLNEQYEVSAVKKVEIPKPNGG
ncbi:MAG: hypothetical protein H6574_12310 [Lewinellaceae bacterium]|nr:hypothetical protein [Lewinellaceae bacterium]